MPCADPAKLYCLSSLYVINLAIENEDPLVSEGSLLLRTWGMKDLNPYAILPSILLEECGEQSTPRSRIPEKAFKTQLVKIRMKYNGPCSLSMYKSYWQPSWVLTNNNYLQKGEGFINYTSLLAIVYLRLIKFPLHDVCNVWKQFQIRAYPY